MLDFFTGLRRFWPVFAVAGLILVALGSAVAVQTLRLQAEQSAHKATKANLTAKLVEEQTANNILRTSQANATATIGGLSAQLLANIGIGQFLEDAAEARCAIIAGAVASPVTGAAPDAGAAPAPKVVDMATSQKVIRYINDAISDF